MSSNQKTSFHCNGITAYLREETENDHAFVYKLIEDFLKTDLSVTFLQMPSFEEFFKLDFKRYVIANGKEIFGFVQIMKNNEIGYFLDPKYEGMGIAIEAVKKLMELNPRERYFATIHNKNEKSIKLVTKLGFYPKGTIYEKIVKDSRKL